MGRELNDEDNSNDGNRSWARGTEPITTVSSWSRGWP